MRIGAVFSKIEFLGFHGRCSFYQEGVLTLLKGEWIVIGKDEVTVGTVNFPFFLIY